MQSHISHMSSCIKVLQNVSLYHSMMLTCNTLILVLVT